MDLLKGINPNLQASSKARVKLPRVKKKKPEDIIPIVHRETLKEYMFKPAYLVEVLQKRPDFPHKDIIDLVEENIPNRFIESINLKKIHELATSSYGSGMTITFTDSYWIGIHPHMDNMRIIYCDDADNTLFDARINY